MLDLIEVTKDNVDTIKFDISHDPVRPELSLEFRLSPGRRVYALVEDGVYKAAICVAYTTKVPTTVTELDFYSQAACQDGQWGNIAVAYTVWSRAPRAGRDIVLDVLEVCKNDPHITRLVTLSPKTDMARRFHLNNGASTLSNNILTDNYEYKL